MIKVLFRTDKKTREVIALLPQLAGDRFYLITCQSYMHVGQHGACSFNYYYESTRPATPDEYRDLLEEMQGIYDNQLYVGHRVTHADYLKRKQQVLDVRPH